MATCPRCGDEYLPLRLYSHRIQCDGKSRIPKSSRAGRVSSPSIRTPGERAADADVTRHSNRGKRTVRPRNCIQIAESRACLYSNRGQSGWERTPHKTSLSACCARGLTDARPSDGSQIPCGAPRPRQPRPQSPIGVLFAFKSRTNFIANVVRDLTTNVRGFSAMNLQ